MPWFQPVACGPQLEDGEAQVVGCAAEAAHALQFSICSPLCWARATDDCGRDGHHRCSPPTEWTGANGFDLSQAVLGSSLCLRMPARLSEGRETAGLVELSRQFRSSASPKRPSLRVWLDTGSTGRGAKRGKASIIFFFCFCVLLLLCTLFFSSRPSVFRPVVECAAPTAPHAPIPSIHNPHVQPVHNTLERKR